MNNKMDYKCVQTSTQIHDHHHIHTHKHTTHSKQYTHPNVLELTMKHGSTGLLITLQQSDRKLHNSVHGRVGGSELFSVDS